MDDTIFSADKEVLVAIVKMTQKQKLKGDKGDWKEFLSVHDSKSGHFNDPAKKSVEDLVAFLKTFSQEEDLKVLAKAVRDLSDRKSAVKLTERIAESESSQQMLVRLTLEHPDYPLSYLFPSKNEEWVVTRERKSSKVGKSSMLAIDCEMVLCQDGSEAVVQVCLVDQNMEVILNELVKPNKAVADYRTAITGISSEDLEGVTRSLADIQRTMKKLLQHGAILVGHSLNHDLRALKLDHARVIDTSYIFDTSTRRKPSLNDLCKAVLGYEVRKDGAPHICLDDAQAAMKLVLAKLENGIDGEVASADNDVPESESAKLLLHAISTSIPQEELRNIFPDFTFDLEPRLNVKKKQPKKYSVDVIFNDAEDARKAFESIKSEEEKDSFGFSQKRAILELSTGFPESLYVRRMVRGNCHNQPTSTKATVEEKKDGSPLNQSTSSKKRSAEVEKKDEKKKKKPKIESSPCDHHVVEIKRLKKELRQRDDEVKSLQKIIAALARKQGL